MFSEMKGDADEGRRQQADDTSQPGGVKRQRMTETDREERES